ncbi:NAD(P)-binding protein [Coniochaeta ligniaria NRRL 30616]|uniref:NAD(P)-binding protein n=1 Tax=Coniochaeta ligniaria NRRL 30616 TaxID=1408157 RepID=A0A1J7IW10_9PEZI|nr:NAD(P)-binding protein [Coniochaeta ligniaria NRRL 30616]
MPIYCITGANRGLGLEFVRQLAADPQNTIFATSRSTSADDISDLKAVSSPNTHVLQCDVADVDSIKSFVGAAGKVLGAKKIDFLLNNAGAHFKPEQTSLHMDPEAILQNVRVNVVGTAKVIQFFYEAGLLSEDVRILNMSSGLGSMERSAGYSPRICAPYSISKAGLNMLTVHLAEDLKAKLPGVVIIVMDPGWVKTRMGGEGAILEAEHSIGGMLKKLHGLKSEDNGKYFMHDGSEVPW